MLSYHRYFNLNYISKLEMSRSDKWALLYHVTETETRLINIPHENIFAYSHKIYNDYSPLNLNVLLIIFRERGNSGFVKLASGREVGIGQLPGAPGAAYMKVVSGV